MRHRHRNRTNAEVFKVTYALGCLAGEKAGNHRINQPGTGGAGVLSMDSMLSPGAIAAAMPP